MPDGRYRVVGSPRSESAPLPSVRPSSMLPRNGQRLPALVALVAALGGGAGIGALLRGETPPDPALAALTAKLDAERAQRGELEDAVRQMLKSEREFRAALGVVLREGKPGSVDVRGLDQNACRLYQDSMSPPVWRVSCEVSQLPTLAP